jgi:hypothetical protein
MPDAPRHTRRQPSTVLGITWRKLNVNALAASLHQEWLRERQSVQDKQEAPNPSRSRASTNRISVAGSHGGRSSKCA